jgi:hypothetical protein
MFQYRGNPGWLVEHPLAGWGDGLTYGAAEIPGALASDPALRVIFSSPDPKQPNDPVCAAPWEHVSVSTVSRTPTWAEMCRVKRLFWADDDVVVKFHPRRRDYINEHPHCLHLWRWTAGDFPVPEPILVGFRKGA